MPSRARARTSRSSMSVACRLVTVVVAEQMQGAVHDQMGCMLFDRHPFVRRFCLANSVGEDDVAEQKLGSGEIGPAEIAFVGHREGQDIGRLFLATPFGIEGAHLLVPGKGHGDFDGPIGVQKLRIAALGDGSFSGLRGEPFPWAATVPFLVGFDRDFEHHRPGPS